MFQRYASVCDVTALSTMQSSLPLPLVNNVAVHRDVIESLRLHTLAGKAAVSWHHLLVETPVVAFVRDMVRAINTRPCEFTSIPRFCRKTLQ